MMYDHDRLERDPDTGLPTIVDDTGVVRKLGTIQAQPTGQYLRWRVAKPRIPMDQWFEVDRTKTFGTDYILDQNGYGACVGYSSAAALMRVRTLCGESYQKLSGMFVYAQVNGGQDQGATIEDAFPVLEKLGCALDSEVPCSSKYIRKANIPSAAYTDALRFKAFESYTVQSWTELCEALLCDYIVVGPVMVGNSFERLDAEGICGVDRGPGNHSVHFDSLMKSPKYGWKARLPNTWGTTFGDNGCCWVTEKHFAQTFANGAGFAIRAALLDPNGPDHPPKVS
jgi:hypothetical protein